MCFVDERCLTPLAEWVTMCDSTGPNQVAPLFENLDDINVCILNLLSLEVRDLLSEESVFVERTGDVDVIPEQSVALAGVEVILAECWCLVYDART